MEFTQETDLQSQGQFSPASHEMVFDRLTMMAQQLKDESDRSLRVSATVDPDDIDVELPAPQAGSVLGWNDDENALTNIGVGSVTLAIPATNSTDNTMLADMPTATIKGRATAGTGDPEDLTVAQTRTLLSLVPDGTTLEIAGGGIRVKDAGIGAAKIANATITGQTAETDPANDDLLLLSDTSATALRKMTTTNFLKVINTLTADASPDAANDYLVTYDASASLPKKVLITNVIGTSAAASTTASGIIELATNAEVQTGTDSVRAIVPSAAKYHQSAAKGWVKFTGSTAAVLDSYGVTSVSDLGVGYHRINWTTSFNNANYVLVANASAAAGSKITACITDGGQFVADISLGVTNQAGTAVDAVAVYAAAFGDLP